MGKKTKNKPTSEDYLRSTRSCGLACPFFLVGATATHCEKSFAILYEAMSMFDVLIVV